MLPRVLFCTRAAHNTGKEIANMSDDSAPPPLGAPGRKLWVMEEEAKRLHAKMVRVLGEVAARELWKKVGKSRPGRIKGKKLVDADKILQGYDEFIKKSGMEDCPRETSARLFAQKLVQTEGWNRNIISSTRRLVRYLNSRDRNKATILANEIEEAATKRKIIEDQRAAAEQKVNEDRAKAERLGRARGIFRDPD